MPDRDLGLAEPRLPTRRAVLAATGLAALAPAIGARARADAAQPRVAIVGAGLAGLACADLLARHGLRPELHEARADRVGGRCWSSRGWRDGQVAEHGGELIDTRHTRMHALARRFDLRLDDTWEGGGRPRLFLGGRRRHRWQFADDMAAFDRRVVALGRRIGPYDYRHAGPRARRVDEMTARELIDQLMPGGSDGVAGRSFHCYLASLYGLDPDDLSAITVVDDRSSTVQGADERYHVHGGNDQIARGLAEALPRGTLTLDSALTSVVRRGDGRIALGFAGGARRVVDAVVLAIPFTTLREVDLDDADLGARKLACIRELGMGTNAKVILQFARRPPCHGGWNGYLDADRPIIQTWESSAGQPGRAGLVTAYFGGRSGDTGLPRGAAHRPAPQALAERVIAQLTRQGGTDLPGLARDYLGRGRLDHWVEDRWTRGSYAAFLPGQYTRYSGFVGLPRHRVFFAGEHTSPLPNQGYLEGAVRSGERAAREVLAALR